MAYDPAFIIGEQVPLPGPTGRLRHRLLGNGQPIDHLRFSLLFDIVRCQAVCTAHNIDGSTLIPEGVIARNDDDLRDERGKLPQKGGSEAEGCRSASGPSHRTQHTQG